MPLFSVVLAMDIPVYRTLDVEADTLAEACEKVRAAWEAPTEDFNPWHWSGFEDFEDVQGDTMRIVEIDGEGVEPVNDIVLSPEDKPYAMISAEELALRLADLMHYAHGTGRDFHAELQQERKREIRKC